MCDVQAPGLEPGVMLADLPLVQAPMLSLHTLPALPPSLQFAPPSDGAILGGSGLHITCSQNCQDF